MTPVHPLAAKMAEPTDLEPKCACVRRDAQDCAEARHGFGGWTTDETGFEDEEIEPCGCACHEGDIDDDVNGFLRNATLSGSANQVTRVRFGAASGLGC